MRTGNAGGGNPPGTLNRPGDVNVTQDHQDLNRAAEEFIMKLADKYGGRLRRQAGYWCGDSERAEDLVQETLTRAWRDVRKTGQTAESGGEKTRGWPWLCAIMYHLWIDGLRTRWARVPETGPDALDRIATGIGEDRLLEAEMVRAALAGLSCAHREVLVKVYWQGLTGTEAAAVLGIPVGTVKSRTFYALKNLKLLLEEQGYTPQ